MPLGVHNDGHDLAWSAVARVRAVDFFQLLNVHAEFCCEFSPASAVYVSLPLANVLVPLMVVLDTVLHPFGVQSSGFDHAVKSISDLGIT